MASGYPDLKQRVVAIQKVLDAAWAAKRLPDERYRAAMALRPHYDVPDAYRAEFNKVRDRHAAEERRQGEIAMRRELRRLAVELDRLRADLPELATAARFDLLDCAREWRE